MIKIPICASGWRVDAPPLPLDPLVPHCRAELCHTQGVLWCLLLCQSFRAAIGILNPKVARKQYLFIYLFIHKHGPVWNLLQGLNIVTTFLYIQLVHSWCNTIRDTAAGSTPESCLVSQGTGGNVASLVPNSAWVNEALLMNDIMLGSASLCQWSSQPR